MALQSIPLIAKEYMDPSTAAKKTFDLPKKPAKGGIPALEKSTMANVTASVGLALDRELKSVIDLTNSSFFLIDGNEGLWASALFTREDRSPVKPANEAVLKGARWARSTISQAVDGVFFFEGPPSWARSSTAP